MMFLAFLGGFLGLLLFGVVLKYLGLVGSDKNALVALEKGMRAELDSRLFSLTNEWNRTLKDLETRIDSKTNAFIPGSLSTAEKHIKQLEAEYNAPYDSLPGAGEA